MVWGFAALPRWKECGAQSRGYEDEAMRKSEQVHIENSHGCHVLVTISISHALLKDATRAVMGSRRQNQKWASQS